MCDWPSACPRSEGNPPKAEAHTSPGLHLGGLKGDRERERKSIRLSQSAPKLFFSSWLLLQRDGWSSRPRRSQCKIYISGMLESFPPEVRRRSLQLWVLRLESDRNAQPVQLGHTFIPPVWKARCFSIWYAWTFLAPWFKKKNLPMHMPRETLEVFNRPNNFIVFYCFYFYSEGAKGSMSAVADQTCLNKAASLDKFWILLLSCIL